MAQQRLEDPSLPHGATGVDRLIVAMRKPEWVAPNVKSARRGPLSDEERDWLLGHSAA